MELKSPTVAHGPLKDSPIACNVSHKSFLCKNNVHVYHICPYHEKPSYNSLRGNKFHVTISSFIQHLQNLAQTVAFDL